MDRTAIFEEMLEKAGWFAGLRGWLYLDGGFEELKSRGANYHQEFAVDRLLHDTGVFNWVQANPPPGFQLLGSSSDMKAQIGVIWKHRSEDPEWADWLQRLMSELNLDDQFMGVLAGDIDVNDYYAKLYDAIRIWGEGDVLMINAPHFTQKHLDVLWKFILSNIEIEKWISYMLETDDGETGGKIWDLPTSVDKLFKKKRWRVAGLRIQHDRLIAEADDWNQNRLDLIWKFAIANMGEIRTFSVLGPEGKFRRGDIWELPKRIEKLFG